jgi:hypothetical protein
MQSIIDLFTHHPRENGVSYVQHMIISLNLCQTFAIASIQSFIHALFPFIFETSSTDTVTYIKEMMKHNYD